MDAVVFQKVRQCAGISQIIDGHNVQMGMCLQQSEKRTTYSSKTVDTNIYFFQTNGLFMGVMSLGGVPKALALVVSCSCTPRQLVKKPGLIDMFVCLIGRSHQGAALHMTEAHFKSDLLILFELVRNDEFLDGKVFFGGLKVLAYGDHIDIGTS